MKRRPSLRRRPESRGQGMDTAPNRDIADPTSYTFPNAPSNWESHAIDAARVWDHRAGPRCLADVSQNHYGLAKAAQDDEKTTVAPAEAGVQGSGHGYCPKPRYRRPLFPNAPSNWESPPSTPRRVWDHRAGPRCLADVSQNHYGLAKAAQDDEKTTVAPAEAGVQGSGHGYCPKPRYRRPLRSQMLHPTGNRRHRRGEGSGIIGLVLDAWRTLVRITMALRRPRKTMKRRPSLRRRPESRGQGMDTDPNRDIADPYVPKCSNQGCRLWTPPGDVWQQVYRH